MKGQKLRGGRVLRRAVQLAGASIAVGASGLFGGCLNRPIEPVEPRTTSTVVEQLKETGVDKIDLLLAIDNSRSMADKQQILVAAVPDLVKGLVNPKCIDQMTGTPTVTQPGGPLEDCPTGSKRDFQPVVDIHIGIITSSLGGHGSDSCGASETFSCPGNAPNTTNNDKGRLISRTDPCAGGSVPTYQNKGFLAWDPTGKKDTPPGEPDLGEISIAADLTVTQVKPGLVPTLKDLVLGAGQIGCGYEAQLESWYRFLVDPEPYDTITVDKATNRAVPHDKDNVLLQQRQDFLRPSSLLAIIMLTDENDCSIKEYGQFWFAAQQRRPDDVNKNFFLPRGRAICQTNPNDKCCVSCGQTAPDGCPDDPTCANPGLDAKTDDVNLRCWDQKRRFGIDFLYPIDRYKAGLTSLTVPNRNGDMVPNPIFSDLNPTDTDTNVRTSELVFLAGIVGVPWQDIARDPTDLKKPSPSCKAEDTECLAKKGFKTSDELGTPDKAGHTTWDYIIGDPDNNVKPLDPHMIESTDPRSGTDPITGVTLAPITAPAGADKINGHEYTVGTKDGVQVVPDDLQYACIFDLPTPRDCSLNLVSCDCGDALNNNPLCDPDPSKGGNRTLQKRAKGYPGIRELSTLKAVGKQGIVASICPAQLDDQGADDFGYRPAIGAIIDRLKVALGGQCLPRTLVADNKGQVSCLVLEGRKTDSCDCNKTARAEVSKDHLPAVDAAKADPTAPAGLNCFCEIEQTLGDDLVACQDQTVDPPLNDKTNKPVSGWCYIDASTNPPTGNVDLVKNCPADEKRLVRFVGEGNAAPGSTLFITCAGQ